ncbi:hypothetical protein DVH24_007048 [Malus domestica]|uniref:Uncharacterized protein n=1 Tax=Malus domestica TaxID=3750 RepID=A0A498HIS2_MALDO|nr:hypothetical protein DVH24_007048 [Malus domestica]
MSLSCDNHILWFEEPPDIIVDLLFEDIEIPDKVLSRPTVCTQSSLVVRISIVKEYRTFSKKYLHKNHFDTELYENKKTDSR